jgi:hypothetical protein
MGKKPAGTKRTTRSRAGRKSGDPERLVARGMSTEGVEVDEAETMASTGNASNAFQEIASGTATGVGLDRAETEGTGGLAAGEDGDEVAEGDYWRKNVERPSYFGSEASRERLAPGEGPGAPDAADLRVEDDRED